MTVPIGIPRTWVASPFKDVTQDFDKSLLEGTRIKAVFTPWDILEVFLKISLRNTVSVSFPRYT